MTIRDQKASMRKLVGGKRERLEAKEVAESDQRIILNLLDLPQYQKAEIIFCFVGTDSEINTKPILLDALSRGKRVCVPFCVTRGIMEAREITKLEDLRDGKYGILEPGEGCAFVDPSEIGFAVIPCVTCDTSGHRLGYGGGYYDRYLENRPFTTAVLCRSALLCGGIPYENHDVVIDIVVTDQEVYTDP